MRLPLRHQILLPVLALVLGVLAATSLFSAWLSQRSARQNIDLDLQQVARTLAEASVPLTPTVLEQMRGLSGAEFVVTDRDRIVASTIGNPLPPAAELLQRGPAVPPANAGSFPVKVGGREYLYASVAVRPAGEAPLRRLHLLYPLENWRRAWWRAVLPSLLAGTVAFLLAGITAALIARRVTGSLQKLRLQVDAIAAGNFREVPPGRRNDEVADLGRAVNRMSSMLKNYQQEIRQAVQQKTLHQVGAGLAHQLRNSATGCRMAVELHALRHPVPEDDSLAVALRQLDVMERYLRGFLDHSRNGHARGEAGGTVSLAGVMNDVRALMEPVGRHLNVALTLVLPPEPVSVRGQRFDLEQMLVILVRNGIEAASSATTGSPAAAAVTLSLTQTPDRIELTVADTGPGPAPAILPRLFEPFVSDKPEGTGLGLSLARAIAHEHDGEIAFLRSDGLSRFVVRFFCRNPA